MDGAIPPATRRSSCRCSSRSVPVISTEYLKTVSPGRLRSSGFRADIRYRNAVTFGEDSHLYIEAGGQGRLQQVMG